MLVSIDDEGLEIFPTHRVTGGAVPELDGRFRRRRWPRPDRPPRRSRASRATIPRSCSSARREAALVEGEQALDTALVDSLRSRRSSTTSAAQAEQAVSSGQNAAFLVRPPTVQQVEEFARAGVRMPPKSTTSSPS